MRRLPFVCAVSALAFLSPSAASAAEPDLDKLLTQCVSATAVVFGPDGTKDPVPVAGSLVLDRDKRLVLVPNTKMPDAPTVLFPMYTAKGELVNDPAEYVGRWKKAERWAGKVVHRDEKRDLAVIELDRALPDRSRAAEFSPDSVPVGSDVYALVQPKLGGDKLWELRKGVLRFSGDGVFLAPGSDPAARPKVVTASASRGTGPDFGLFAASGRVVGFSSPPNTTGQPAWGWLDVSELRGFLTEKKVPFRSAPETPKAKDPKAKQRRTRRRTVVTAVSLDRK